MLKEYKDKLEQLKQYSRMETEEDIKKFELLLSELPFIEDKEDIEMLFDLFDDECEFCGVMNGLVKYLEHYPHKIYIQMLINNIRIFFKAPDWYSLLFCRVLNHNIYYTDLRSQIKKHNPKSLNKLLDYIEQDSDIPRHKEQIEELRELAGLKNK